MPHRTITDSSGRAWDVWETKPGPRSQVSPTYRDGWLTFEAVGAPPMKRRSVPIPDKWDEWGEAQIVALLHSATPIESAKRTTLLALEESTAPPPPQLPG